MIVVCCTLTLQLDGVHSLKEKRQIVQSIMARMRQQFNITIAEVDQQDVWQTAVIGLATVGNETAHLHTRLQKAVTWLEQQRPDVPILSYHIETW